MSFLHFDDFSKAVTEMLTEGLKAGTCDVTLTKSGSEGSTVGPYVVNLARENASGGLGGMAQTSIADLGGKKGIGLQAMATPDATLYATLKGLPEAFGVEGLNVDWQAMFNPQYGPMPLANLDVKCFREGFTFGLQASPMQGLVGSLTTGKEAVMVGSQVIFSPSGYLAGNTLAVTYGGMVTGILSMPTYGRSALQCSAMVPLTPASAFSFVGEKEIGASGHSAAVGLCHFFEAPKVVAKGLVAWTDSPVGKVSLQKSFPVGQMGINLEIPFSKTDGTSRPAFGLSAVLSL
eukprot:CAMPEP_0171911858 /NCGR_PEP_ID=MMETSP0993-20121228/10619_1 /TAXON_ID=483369 /ORGANISM="non described non described, Strain CCMP2098" /LENGTH=290 /DNA_ID=CAMNT_0012545489 /DNA_START=55 /DNA_END=927 /DNA_ORIENTATION=+